MGLLDRFRKLSDDDLRHALFDAVAQSDASRLADLLARNRERIAALFATWQTIPEIVRSDPSRVKWWAEGMIGIAKESSARGDGSLMAQLQGPRDQNILIQWQDAFVEAQAEAEAGDLAAAISRLERILELTEGLTGAGVDHLGPKTCGLLGTLYYRARNLDRARELTARARTDCERIGDAEGVATYDRNLAVILKAMKPPPGTRIM